MSATTRVPIEIPGAPTSLLVARGAIGRLGALLGEEGVPVAGRRVLVAADRNTTHLASPLLASLTDAGADTATIHLEATELRKSLATVDAIWQAALAHRIDRGGLLIALGGGIVGDVAGFAAASYLRGIELVQVPTTLLAMVDASIGGKTGINLLLPGGALGKNLAGAFWQPRLTVADPDALATLPPRELRAGLAECVKHAVIAGEPLFSLLDGLIEPAAAGDAAALGQLVPASARVKAGVVARDPLERGERAKLNLGHTFGHAIETLPGHDLLHGEAVAIGLHAACACATARGMLESSTATRITGLLERAGLPIRLAQPASAAEIRRRMGFDKKVAGGRMRLILPCGIGEVAITSDAPGDPTSESATSAALAAIGASE